jgi:hypothetical protein
MERPNWYRSSRRKPSPYQLGVDFGQRPIDPAQDEILRFTHEVKHDIQIASPDMAGAYLVSHIFTPFEAFDQENDVEEITRYIWFRYLQWLLRKHKGSRKHQLIQSQTKVICNRTRWTTAIEEGGEKIAAHQWLPTQRELDRRRYRMKGRGGFPHPYLDERLRQEDHP